MLLCEVLEKIKSRQFPSDYAEMDGIIENGEADRIAMECIKAQMRLADMLNDFYADFKPEDKYTATLVKDMLNEIRYDWEEKNGLKE